VRNQTAAVLDEIVEQRERFRVENDLLLRGAGGLSPEGLIDFIESERRK
jgi:hypothetical protein